MNLPRLSADDVAQALATHKLLLADGYGMLTLSAFEHASRALAALILPPPRATPSVYAPLVSHDLLPLNEKAGLLHLLLHMESLRLPLLSLNTSAHGDSLLKSSLVVDHLASRVDLRHVRTLVETSVVTCILRWMIRIHAMVG